MHLVVGLGNPGRRYDGTRHNVGFRVVERLCARWGLDPKGRAEHGSIVCAGLFQGMQALVARPQQYMNRSGLPVAALMGAHGVALERVVVVHDEMGLPPGTVRCRTSGGHGGHNGLRDLIEHIGRDFLRVRLGIGRPAAGGDVSSYVLGTFTDDEQAPIDDAIEAGCDAVEVILADGIIAAQNRFNVRAPKLSLTPPHQTQQPRPGDGALEQS